MGNSKLVAGSQKEIKAFDTVVVDGQKYDLIFGEHPHSLQENNMYVRSKNGRVDAFDGHRHPFKIEIEEFNYMKESEVSGDEVRKGGKAILYVDGVKCFEQFCRNYEMGYRFIQDFIMKMEMNWSWFPHNPDEKIGALVEYKQQVFKIRSIDVECADMILETLDGQPRKKFLPGYPAENADQIESIVKVSIVSEHIDWFPKP